MSDHFVVLDVSLSADQYIRVYQSTARHVLARDMQGRSVQFPARALQRFVTRDGVHGRFKILFDEQGKLRGIERLL